MTASGVACGAHWRKVDIEPQRTKYEARPSYVQ